MRWIRIGTVAVILSSASPLVGRGEFISATLIADESVVSNSITTTKNFNTLNFDSNTGGGGLWSGVFNGNPDYGMMRARFYLKFDLPDFAAYGHHVTLAKLCGWYLNDINTIPKPGHIDSDTIHDVFLAANDSWTESTITWNNQPGKTGASIGFFDAAPPPANPPEYIEIPLDPAVVNMEYQGDGILSLVVLARTEDADFLAGLETWEYFGESELGPACSFRLCLEIAPAPPAWVALIGMVVAGAVMGAAGWFRKWRLCRAG